MRILCVLLTYILCIQVFPRAYAQGAPTRIQMTVVRGEGALNSLGKRSSLDPVVRIEDEAGKPVKGASVVFTLPADGASGVFGNGDKTLIVVTDARGEAEASGLRMNTIPGRLPIHVNASYRGQTARLNVTQFNMTVPGKRQGGGSGKAVLIILAIAGAAGGGAAFALRNQSKSTTSGAAVTPPPIPIGIAPGIGSVGPPR